jgi:hypothetical protein
MEGFIENVYNFENNLQAAKNTGSQIENLLDHFVSEERSTTMYAGKRRGYAPPCFQAPSLQPRMPQSKNKNH